MNHFGRYEIIETIGQGAMGAVYKARDPVMDRTVAIKTILSTALGGPLAEEFRDRFQREARAAGRLSHPGIVTMFDVGEEGETPFLVMEYIAGRTLESALESGERFAQGRVLELGQQLAEALDYAHENGVVHRDIKPANILLTGSPERAKIADFGVAKVSSAQATATGRILGTPSFMAPEQFTGSPIDGRADLFSLGVILYWMATGDKPFTGETITAVSYKIVHTEPIAPRKLNPAIPRAVEDVVLKCLEKDPAARYPRGAQLARDLATLQAGSTAIWAQPHQEEQDPEKTRPMSRESVTGVAVPIIAAEVSGAGRDRTVAAASPPPQAPRPAASTSAQHASSVAPAKPAAHARPRAAEPPKSRTGIIAGAVAAILAVLAAGAYWRYQQTQSRPAGTNKDATAVVMTTPTSPPAGGATATSPSVAAPSVPAIPAAPAPAPEPTANGKTTPAKSAATPEKKARSGTEGLEGNSAARTEKLEPSATSPTAPHTLELEVSATSPANLELQSDGEPVVSRQLSSGGSLHAAADKALWLRTDSAGALRLRLNGYDLPSLGAVGMPRSLRLTPQTVSALRAGTFGGPTQIQPAPPQQVGRAQLFIRGQRIPNGAVLTILVDGQMLFQRPAMAVGGAGPVNQEKDLSPGTHTIRVVLARPWMPQPLRQDVSGSFQPGAVRTLLIVFTRNPNAPPPAREGQLAVTLE